ncbi:RNA polymerase III transcription initiation factor complex component [Nemania sp. FL0031]|nr:RNA polymerase III transcription initiation factor complex component [Nemania sp. FL0031]
MSLEVIYVVRHGFRSSWSVDHVTGTYTSTLRSPTGLPTDPALTSHGVEQADELARHLMGLNPPIDLVYSSPYYRCLQTISPFISRRNSRQSKASASPSKDDVSPSRLSIRVESGLSEWYGRAHFEHPTSAPLSELCVLFADLDADHVSLPTPRRRGESIPQLYERTASCIQTIIDQCDQEGKRAVVISTHAAVVIALGRVLTANVPEDASVEDFGAFTCGLSVYRRQGIDQGRSTTGTTDRAAAIRDQAPMPADPPQTCGFGLSSHWRCEVNSDCSFLRGGEERGWKFSGDESFVEVGREGLLLSTLESRPHSAVGKDEDISSGTGISKL